MFRKFFGFALIIAVFIAGAVHADELQIDQKREEDRKAYGSSVIPNPQALRATAKSLLEKPLEQQSLKELQTVADEANRYANLVGYLTQEYSSYYRDNYQYKFVQEKVAPPRDAYQKSMNEFIDLRNIAYFNLGLKAKVAGNLTEALFYFRDTFRLSSFDCFTTPREKCMRWLAEQELQKFLGLESVTAYTTWK